MHSFSADVEDGRKTHCLLFSSQRYCPFCSTLSILCAHLCLNNCPLWHYNRSPRRHSLAVLLWVSSYFGRVSFHALCMYRALYCFCSTSLTAVWEMRQTGCGRLQSAPVCQSVFKLPSITDWSQVRQTSVFSYLIALWRFLFLCLVLCSSFVFLLCTTRFYSE